MAIKRNTQDETASMDSDTPAPALGFELKFVDELPAPMRGATVGRQVSAETLALIDALQSRPNTYAHVDVRRTCQPNKTLRNAGILETFRKRDDGAYDRYAAFVGLENIPQPKPRAPKVTQA